MPGRIISTADCVAEGADWLCAREPRFAAALQMTGPLPLRRTTDGFETLFDAIVSQQISVAAANSIGQRLAAAGLNRPRAVAGASQEALRACGLSRAKVRYVQALASSNLDYHGLRRMADEDVIGELVKITGIGRWTAEIYAMFALGRADVFAQGDLALQEAARLLFELDARPSPAEIAGMAQNWSPWRAVAARLLWAYYRVAKNREGIAV
jgi:DNA-3-methyladenine glycosylase II